MPLQLPIPPLFIALIIVALYLKLGVVAIWIVLSVELVIRGLLILAHFVRGKWKQVQV